MEQLEDIPSVAVITNKMVLDFARKHTDVSNSNNKRDLCDAFEEVFCFNHTNTDPVDPAALSMKIHRLKKNNRKFGKNNKKGLEDFLGEEFSLPSHQTNEQRQLNSTFTETEKKLMTQVNVLTKEKKQLKRKVETFSDLETKYAANVDCLTSVKEELSTLIKSKHIVDGDLRRLRGKYEKSEEDIKDVRQRIANLKKENDKVYAEKESVKRKLVNKTTDVDDKGEQINKLELENANSRMENKQHMLNIRKLEDKLTNAKCDITDFKLERRRLSYKLDSLKKKIDDNGIANIECSGLQKECDDLQSDVDGLRKENSDLEQLVEILQDNEIVTFANGRFTDEIRHVIMELVSLNVSINKVNEVVKAVLQTLTKKDVEKLRLPSDGTRKAIMEESLILAQLQVAEAMKENVDGLMGNCLHGDGTTKYSRHYQNFQITTRRGKTLSFGLSEVADSDAAAVLKTFISTIDDICDVLEGNKEKNFASLVTSIKNTMSDLGPVNPLFNNHLKAFREELLPEAMNNWDKLDEDKKREMIEMGNFFCKLHLLSNFATETDKMLKEFEKVMMKDDYEKQFAFNTKESSPVQLVRIACKAFHVRGSDECGVASYFNAHLRKREETSRFESFIGNRFNILYYNAAALYFHKEAITEFLENWPDHNTNKLLKSVDELMKNPFNVACVRALGIVEKILTGPFWRIIEHCDNILSMTPYLLTMKGQLDKLRKDAQPIFEGDTIFDESDELVKVTRDDVYEKLFEDTENDELEVLTWQALEQIFHAILTILERQAKDQLQGGRYYNPSESVKESSSNVPAHNKASESDFAIFDLLIRTKPNARVETLQSMTMWCRNDTANWYKSKPEDERNKLMQTAISKKEVMKVSYNKRRKEILQRKEEIVLKRQNDKKIAQCNAAIKRSECVNALISLGTPAWISVESANENFQKIPDEKKMEVVNAQLMFYKHVMLVERKAPTDYFTKSKKGVKLTFEEMFQKLLKVIEFTKRPIDQTKHMYTVLKPKAQREEELAARKNKLQQKVIETRLSSEIERRNNLMVPIFLREPMKMVGCKIKHRLKESKDAEETWCDGEVINIKKMTDDPRKVVYTVKYDDDTEELYDFPLLLDMEKKDLFITQGM